MVTVAAATGLRPGEGVALEWRDIDHEARVVYVQRSFGKGRLKRTKTETSVRAVPLQAITLAALEQLPAGGPSDLLFPAANGGYFHLHNFRNRKRKPAQRAVGIEPLHARSFADTFVLQISVTSVSAVPACV
jgi:integrase